MVTVNDVTQMMFRWAPPELAMDWDNVGLLVGRGDREVHRVLVALDVSPDVAAEAAETGTDLIVSHHPVMNIRWHAQQMQTLREDTRLGRARVQVQDGQAAMAEPGTVLVPDTFAIGATGAQLRQPCAQRAFGKWRSGEGSQEATHAVDLGSLAASAGG